MEGAANSLPYVFCRFNKGVTRTMSNIEGHGKKKYFRSIMGWLLRNSGHTCISGTVRNVDYAWDMKEGGNDARGDMIEEMKTCRFLRYFTHDDATYGGEWGNEVSEFSQGFQFKSRICAKRHLGRGIPKRYFSIDEIARRRTAQMRYGTGNLNESHQGF